jgi:hypothetical protein
MYRLVMAFTFKSENYAARELGIPSVRDGIPSQ